MEAPRPKFVLVLRHAQRQDEISDAWTQAESQRPGGRPWDPPLSETGLAQAAKAGLQVAAWERRSGVRISAVVVSPFLR